MFFLGKASSQQFKKTASVLTLALSFMGSSLPQVAEAEAVSIGVVAPLPAPQVHRIAPRRSARPTSSKFRGKSSSKVPARKTRPAGKQSPAPSKAAAHPAAARAPQDYLSKLSRATLAPGVVYFCHRGPLNINILNVDLNEQSIEVKPVLAGDCFNRLDEVRVQAEKVNAIAAVNANYFKYDGTPLGTLIMDGEWISGPLFDRISFGLTEDRNVHVDRANLHGILETSNPAVSRVWVNNINQPRRTGSKLIVYTRRWGSFVKMPYQGTLIAVDSTGRVVDTSKQTIAIPYGGFVLSDKKESAVSALKRGDLVFLDWQHRPDRWSNVVQAVSGGPALIRNGNLYLDLKDEHFKKNWTSSSIHARTALGVTRDKHLILMTVEGPHTLWDLAKALQKLGCVEAMNLDGGGSTTMVVKGNTVTRNKNSQQRRVAVSLAVLPRGQSAASLSAARHGGSYIPKTNLTNFAPISAASHIAENAVGTQSRSGRLFPPTSTGVGIADSGSLDSGFASSGALVEKTASSSNAVAGAAAVPAVAVGSAAVGSAAELESLESSRRDTSNIAASWILPAAPALADPIANSINLKLVSEAPPPRAEKKSNAVVEYTPPKAVEIGRSKKKSKKSKDRAFGWMKKIKF